MSELGSPITHFDEAREAAANGTSATDPAARAFALDVEDGSS